MIFDRSLSFFSGFQWYTHSPRVRVSHYLSSTSVLWGHCGRSLQDSPAGSNRPGRTHWAATVDSLAQTLGWAFPWDVGKIQEDHWWSKMICWAYDLLGKSMGKSLDWMGFMDIFFWDITSNLIFECVWKWEMDPGTGNFNGDNRDN